MIETTYNVRVVGQLWWEGVAAMDYTIRVADLPEYPRADDETELQYEARMVQCATPDGDFSNAEGWEIVRRELWHESPEPHGVYLRPLGESTTYTTKQRYTTLMEFTDEQSTMYDDCHDYGDENER